MRDGTRSYCGLRENIRGKMESLVSTDFALVHAYEDPLPTNCCAAWFCGAEHGYNLAVFFYGCNFDCLFCQNASHKEISSAPGMSLSEFVAKVHDRIKCVCYFGGSPEPQLPFAIKASELILERRNMRICWEWNGCGNEKLVKRAAELSFWSDGIIKFDLKAFDPNLSVALSGVPNERAYENFKIIANDFSQILTATTLLVPNYVGEEEVRGIAKFIASIDPDIPYSLLVFHPDFYMLDLGITPRRQVEACYRVAKRYLRRVNIGNRYLLPGS
jgi:pyruvate formate lyase activating enzyme